MRRILVLCLFILSTTSASAQIAIRDAWLREPVAGRDVTAAYMTFTNRGEKAVLLEKVSSPLAGSVEIHESKVTDGVMSMRPAAGILIGPGRSVTLAPGGLHLMLIGVVRTLTAGERIEMLLEFDDGSRAKIEATVRGGDEGHDHHHAH